MIKVTNLTKQYGKLKAVDDVSFTIEQGEVLGLVGESGCGKSTLARLLMSLDEPTSGAVYFDDKNLFSLPHKELKELRRDIQMIFQDPYSSLNPRMTAKEIIEEPLLIHGIPTQGKAEELLHLVGLHPEAQTRYPHEFSGGQKQRIGIARALALGPRFLICDEPISALDVSIQAQIANLLKKLQKERGLTLLFIAHDLSMVKYLSTRIAVMYLGKIVEVAPAAELYANPKHPYTQALFSAIPIPDPVLEKQRPRLLLKGELPNPNNPPPGCPFHHPPPHPAVPSTHVAPKPPPSAAPPLPPSSPFPLPTPPPATTKRSSARQSLALFSS